MDEKSQKSLKAAMQFWRSLSEIERDRLVVHLQASISSPESLSHTNPISILLASYLLSITSNQRLWNDLVTFTQMPSLDHALLQILKRPTLDNRVLSCFLYYTANDGRTQLFDLACDLAIHRDDPIAAFAVVESAWKFKAHIERSIAIRMPQVLDRLKVESQYSRWDHVPIWMPRTPIEMCTKYRKRYRSLFEKLK